MKNLLTLIVILVTFSTFGQTVQVVNGKKGYVHQVVKGNTLYSISNQYNVSVSDILNNNPTAEKGLKIGDELFIPLAEDKEANAKEPLKTTVTTAEKTPGDTTVQLKKFHVVDKQETLYSISKLYGVSINDLVKLNPGIEVGVKIGQRIIVPDGANKSTNVISSIIVYYDTVIPHKVAKTETLYSVSKRYMVPQKDIVAYNGIKGNTLKPDETIYIPLKKEEYKPVEIRDVKAIKIEEKPKLSTNDFVFQKKDTYKVVVALPLGLGNTTEKFGTIATEFYMGAEYALDSLAKLGLNADVYVVDCSGDTTAFKTKLNTHKDADLIIGPFFGSSMDIAAKFSESNKIKIINPLVGYTKPLQGNEYVTNAMTSDVSLMEGLAVYVSKKVAGGKVLLIKPTAADMSLYNAFRNKLHLLNASTGVKFIECELTDFTGYLAKGVNTALIYPSRDANSVTKFMNILHQNSSKIGSGDINVYGTKEWTTMDRVKNYYKNTYNMHFAMANELNYSDANTIKFHKGFRAKFNTDLTKVMAQGFDVTFYFLSKMFMNKNPKDLLMNEFTIKKVSANDGFENTSTFIYKQVDFEYVLMDKVF